MQIRDGNSAPPAVRVVRALCVCVHGRLCYYVTWADENHFVSVWLAACCCHVAQSNVTFEIVSGPGRVIATHNGHQSNHQPNHAPYHTAFHGLVRGIVQVRAVALLVGTHTHMRTVMSSSSAWFTGMRRPRVTRGITCVSR